MNVGDCPNVQKSFKGGKQVLRDKRLCFFVKRPLKNTLKKVEILKYYALTDIHHKFATIYERFVACLVKETCSILNKDATSESSGFNCIDLADTFKAFRELALCLLGS